MIREQFCFWCGDALSKFDAYGELLTCGKSECERGARDQQQAERDEAHEQLDRDMGWR
jgi:hypothetical protein